MAAGRVVQLSIEHIPSLVTRLSSYGVHSVQTRNILRLLQTRINTAPFRIFTVGSEGTDLVTVTAMTPTPGFKVLDVCGREDSACRRRLDALLRSPELADLWRGPVRVEFMAEGLAPVLTAAAEDNGLRRVLGEGETLRLYVRADDLPVPPLEDRPGVSVRPLELQHLPKVQHFWPYRRNNSGQYPDMDPMMRDGVAAGLSAGVFVADPAEAETDWEPDQPVSWGLMNSYGAHSIGYTEKAYRGRGFMQLLMVELNRRTLSRGLSCFGYIVDTNIGQVQAAEQQGSVPTKLIAQRISFSTK